MRIFGLVDQRERLAQVFGRRSLGRQEVAAGDTVDRLATLVSGRDACHHPDGTARLVHGALRVLADEIGLHLSGRCSARDTA